jgi:hypothetical protein
MPRNPEVDAFLADLDHPLRDEIKAVRAIVLGVDKRITESIKWGGPTFAYQGNIATIPPRTKKAVQLFFQHGALIGARYGVLEGDGDHVRTINFKDKAEIAAKKAGTVKAIKAWIKHKGG